MTWNNMYLGFGKLHKLRHQKFMAAIPFLCPCCITPLIKLSVVRVAKVILSRKLLFHSWWLHNNNLTGWIFWQGLFKGNLRLRHLQCSPHNSAWIMQNHNENFFVLTRGFKIFLSFHLNFKYTKLIFQIRSYFWSNYTCLLLSSNICYWQYLWRRSQINKTFHLSCDKQFDFFEVQYNISRTRLYVLNIIQFW